jgi:hypothetical protein
MTDLKSKVFDVCKYCGATFDPKYYDLYQIEHFRSHNSKGNPKDGYFQAVRLEDAQKEIYERLEWHEDLLKNKIDALGQRLEQIHKLVEDAPAGIKESLWLERLRGIMDADK